MNRDWTKLQSETIDTLRPIMAFMVICLHTQLFYVDEQWTLNSGIFDIFIICFCKTLCPVAVPMFFFISGYLFYKGLEDWNPDVWKHKMAKRIRTLLVPFLLWNLIALIAFPLTRLGGSILKDVPIGNLWEPFHERGFLRLFWDRTLFDGITYNTTNLLGWSIPSGHPMDTPLWFVRDLMVVIIFTPVIHWLVKKTGSVIVFLLAALFLTDIWIPISGFGIKATFFFTWGSLFSIRRKTFLETFRRLNIPIVILFIAGLVLIPFLWDKDKQIFNLVIRLFIIIAIMFCVNTVSQLLEKGVVQTNSKLTASSFFIYCAHMVIIASAVMWAIIALPFRSGAMRTILFLAGAIVIFLICHFIYIFLERYCPSVASILTGGRNHKKEKT